LKHRGVRRELGNSVLKQVLFASFRREKKRGMTGGFRSKGQTKIRAEGPSS